MSKKNVYTKYFFELRKRLISVLVVFSIGFLFGFVFFRFFLNIFLEIFQFHHLSIVVTSPFQIFSLAVNTGIFLGVIFSFPMVIYNFYSFIKPALDKNERRKAIPLLFISLTLFLIGFGFGLFLMRWVILELSMAFYGSQINNFWDIGLFLSQIILTSVFLGVVFQFPLLLIFLVKIGLIKVKDLEKKKYYIIMASFIIIALLPPTDALSLILMVTPIIIMFKLTPFVLKKE